MNRSTNELRRAAALYPSFGFGAAADDLARRSQVAAGARGERNRAASKAAIEAARAEGRAPAVEICRLCEQHAAPALAASYIAKDVSVDQVRASLAALGDQLTAAASSLDARASHVLATIDADALWNQAFKKARSRAGIR